MQQHGALRVFTFTEEKRRRDSLTVFIPEVLDPQFSMYVWPSAVVLAQYVWSHKEALRSSTVLELGAGVSLPGVVAARCGARVTLTDTSDWPLCLRNCRRSCDASGAQGVAVVGLTWGETSPELLLLPEVDVILGSDVFYQPEDFEDLLLTVSFLLRRNPRAEFWTTYQLRSPDWSMEALLRRWRLRCVLVPLADFDADRPLLAGSSLPGHRSVQMMVVSRGTDT